MCRTRWAERHSAYQHFYQCYKFIVIAFEAIALGLHQNDLSDNFAGATWSSDCKSNANSLLHVHAVTSFEFVIAFLTVYQYLSHLSGITVKLQSRTLDIIEAYQHVDDIKQFYKELRKNSEVDFHKVYQQAERMATAVNVDPSKPRSCARQRNRPNAQVETVEEWYRVNVAVPFLDHILAELDSQFSVLAQTSSKLLELVPSGMCFKKDLDLSEVVQLYCNDLISPEQFD